MSVLPPLADSKDIDKICISGLNSQPSGNCGVNSQPPSSLTQTSCAPLPDKAIPQQSSDTKPRIQGMGVGRVPCGVFFLLLFNIKMRQKAKSLFEIIHAEFWFLFPPPR